LPYRYRRLALPVFALAGVLLASCGGGGGAGSAPLPLPSSPAGLAPGAANPTRPVPTPAPILPSPAPTAVACSGSDRIANVGRRPALAAAGIVPDRLVVSYRTGTRGVESVDRTVGAARAMTVGERGGVTQRALTLPAGTDLNRAAAALRATAGIVDVQPVHYRTLASDAQANDPLVDTVDQWYTYITGVDVNPSRTIGANAAAGVGAWQLAKGSTAITIAVIDTGIDQNNADLAAHLVKAESIVGGAVSSGAQDTNGHGTNVAGLAASAANNGYGFGGVAYNVSLLAYKVFPDATSCSNAQTTDTADIAAAINDAVASGANVINLSLGAANYKNAGFDRTEYDAVENAIRSGVTVVAANGNEFAAAPGNDGSVPNAPASYPGVIAVGASSNEHATPNAYDSIMRETIASYSNSGPALVAPGGDPPAGDDGSDRLNWIKGYGTTTAAYSGDRCYGTGGVCTLLFAGTSQATPQVTGTVALMIAYHGGAIAPATVKSILTANADLLPGISPERQGAGRLNAYKALLAAAP
jgi:hypothetical protein